MTTPPTKAWKLIEQPEKWTQHTVARDEDGLHCEIKSLKAVCWCAIGAIARCYDAREADKHQIRIREILGGPISVFNDSHTHAEVVALLKKHDV